MQRKTPSLIKHHAQTVSVPVPVTVEHFYQSRFFQLKTFVFPATRQLLPVFPHQEIDRISNRTKQLLSRFTISSANPRPQLTLSPYCTIFEALLSSKSNVPKTKQLLLGVRTNDP